MRMARFFTADTGARGGVVKNKQALAGYGAEAVPEDLRPLIDDPAVGTPPAVEATIEAVDIARLII